MPEGPDHPVLGQTAEQYAAACVARRAFGGRVGAFDRYSRLFREGVTEQPHLNIAVPHVNRTHLSESHEGAVLKFTQAVGRLGASQERATGGEGRISLIPDASLPPLEIESVLIPMIGRKRVRSYTLCVSSQVGCAMGCTFCQTAQMGLIRSLSSAEIVGQWFAARHLVQRPDPAAAIDNIVFMGMGEPMDNLPEVIQAIRVLTDRRGPSLAMSQITVSTVGRVDGIRALAGQVRQTGWHRLGLAVSLNAPSDQVRSSIMPVNRAMPMAMLRRELEQWPFFGGAHLCLEYVFIPGVNDSRQHAEQLAAFVKGNAYDGPAEPRYPGDPLRGLVNVIPYNPRANSPWSAPTEEAADEFMEWLKARQVYCKRRRTKGRDTMAACGQLGNPELTRRKLKAADA